MKKLFLSAAVAVFSFASLSAQDISFGVKGGVNFANIAGDFGAGDLYDDNDTKMKVGFHIGGLAEIMLSEKFALQPELLFSMQGAKSEYDYDDGFDSESFESKINLSYINLPIMAKFYPIENLAIEMGPQVGFLVSAKSDYESTYTTGGVTVSESGDDDVKDQYKGIDFGLNFGASYKLDSGLFFSARYNLGLTKVDDDDYYDDIDGDLGIFSSTFSRKNRVIQLSAGFMF